ncbi:hypothetical protein FRB99_005397 [Tulasnella sp. 403]|nr:hypothetical protein FRB99_005397 [Tulasnella sp. 403]
MLPSLCTVFFALAIVEALPPLSSLSALTTTSGLGSVAERTSGEPSRKRGLWGLFGSASTEQVCPFQDKNRHSVKITGQSGDGMNDIVQTFTVNFIGHGNNGCIYKAEGEFLNPFTNDLGEVVLKTPRIDSLSPFLEDLEVEALRGVQQLFFTGMLHRRQWAIIKWHDGSRLIDHPAYRRQFNSRLYNYMSPSDSREVRELKITKCVSYMEAQYDKIVEMNIQYALMYGWMTNDMNWNNFLFDFSEDALPNNIDWGDAFDLRNVYMDGRGPFLDDFKRKWKEYLETRSAMPLHDNEIFQGICTSQRRDNGQRWEHFDVAAANYRAKRIEQQRKMEEQQRKMEEQQRKAFEEGVQQGDVVDSILFDPFNPWHHTSS